MKLFNLMQMDASSLIVLLPRITDPLLSADEVEKLEPCDFFTMATEVLGFFMAPDQIKQAQEQMQLQ